MQPGAKPAAFGVEVETHLKETFKVMNMRVRTTFRKIMFGKLQIRKQLKHTRESK